MEKLVSGFLKFRTEIFGKKKELFTRLSENQASPDALHYLFRFAGRPHPPHTNRSGGALYSQKCRHHGAAIRLDARRQHGHHRIRDGRLEGSPHHRVRPHRLRRHEGPAEPGSSLRPARGQGMGRAGRNHPQLDARALCRPHGQRSADQDDPRKRPIPARPSSHPSVRRPSAAEQVDLHGWVYSISTGDVWVYDFELEQFTSLLDETYPRLKTSS